MCEKMVPRQQRRPDIVIHVMIVHQQYYDLVPRGKLLPASSQLLIIAENGPSMISGILEAFLCTTLIIEALLHPKAPRLVQVEKACSAFKG